MPSLINRHAPWDLQALRVLGGLALFLGACSSPDAGDAPSHPAIAGEAGEPGQTTTTTNPVAPRSSEIVISPRTMLLSDYPCSTCHVTVSLAQAPAQAGTAPRGPHRGMTLRHMATVRNCQVCHPLDDLDQLRLLDDSRIPFDNAHEVCGQCHAERKRDWDLGIHGKQIGSWRGVKHRYACTRCHDPHAPARPTMTAYPPPPFPEQGIRKRHGEAHGDARNPDDRTPRSTAGRRP